MPVFMQLAEGRRRRRPADHAGRPHPLERPADRRRAGRNAGAGRPRQIPDPRHLRGRAAVDRLRRGQGAGHRARHVPGPAAESEIGDAEAALAAAPVSVDASYSTPRHNHNAIEPHAATLAWIGDELIVHDASQAVAHTAWSLADVFGLDETQVRVTSPYVGGGFGSKTLWQHQVLGAAAAKLAGRPVRIALSREGVYRLVGGRTVTEQRVAIGARGGWPLRPRIIHTGTVAMTPHNAMPEPFILATRGAYAAGSFKLDVEGGLHGHARQHLHARAGRGGRHVRPGVRRRRAGREARHGSDRAAHPQRAGEGPDARAAVLLPQHRARPGGRVRNGSAGQAQRGARVRARGRVAGRHGLRHRDLPVLPHARRGRAHHARQGRPRPGRDRRARDGHGHRNRADPGRRRAARAGDATRSASAMATPSCPAPCWPAARSRRPRSARP